MNKTDTNLLASIRSVAFDLDELDSIRSRILRKRAALLAYAIDETELNRMDIAVAAGITLNRAYAIASQARGITPPALQLVAMPQDSHLIQSAEAVELWGDEARDTEWLAFPYVAGDTE